MFRVNSEQLCSSFCKKKALFCFAEVKMSRTQISAKPTQGVWGLAPKEIQ
jgi:hypothetical protein